MAKVYSDACRLIDHLRLPGERPTNKLVGKHKPRFTFANRSIHSHFTECRVDLICSNIGLPQQALADIGLAGGGGSGIARAVSAAARQSFSGFGGP